jgi:hypothetical protein
MNERDLFMAAQQRMLPAAQRLAVLHAKYGLVVALAKQVDFSLTANECLTVQSTLFFMSPCPA